MKKVLGLMVIAFLISIVMPLNARALSAEIFASNASMTETTEGGKTFSIKNGNGWSGTITKSETGNGIDIKLTNSTGLTSRKVIVSINLTVSDNADSTDTCMVTLSSVDTPTSTPKCQVVNGVYYDANGNEVSEEAYNEVCATSENPQTGSFLPYTLIIAGLALAGWLYYVTKKNNKIYQV